MMPSYSMQIASQKDMRKLLAAFRNFAKAPKLTMRIPVFGNVIRRRCVCSGIPVGYS